jgi:DNA-binding NtrC family response regulator
MIDDEMRQARALMKKLTASGIAVTLVSSATDVLALFKEERFDVVVLDIRLSDLHGLGLLEKLRRGEPTVAVIIHTNNATADSAVQSMKRGAYDYLTKPCDVQKLIEVIGKAAKASPKKRAFVLNGHLKGNPAIDDLIGESQAMRNVKKLIELVAPAQTPVLILGETGTGKELVARAIHDQSPRRESPLMVVNSGALQETILESELFGYKRGAFTDANSDKKGLLEVANHGTCFIDEVGDMELRIQTKVLRVIESGVFMKLGDTRETKVDVRFLFATNKDPASSIECGGFRKDLLYRINAFTLNLPSLRQRREDVALLANFFLRRFSREEKCLSEKVVKLLKTYNWPGNVRELVNAIQRSILVSGARKTIMMDDLPENIIHLVGLKRNQRKSESAGKIRLTCGHEEHLAKVIDFTAEAGNKAETAGFLGVRQGGLLLKGT